MFLANCFCSEGMPDCNSVTSAVFALARKTGFTVYRPATVNMAEDHFSFISEGQRGPVFTNTYAARQKFCDGSSEITLRGTIVLLAADTPSCSSVVIME